MRPFAVALLCTVLGVGFALAQSDVRLDELTHEKPDVGQLRALPGETWAAEVGGTPVRYHLVSLEGFSSLGYFVLSDRGSEENAASRRCDIYIDTWFARHASLEAHLAVVLHEVGHCIDATTLHFNHNAFASQGCVYGSYYCTPAEGYAEAWRYAYLARCGLNAQVIGYEPVLLALGHRALRTPATLERSAECVLPRAEGVLPPLFAADLIDARLSER